MEVKLTKSKGDYLLYLHLTKSFNQPIKTKFFIENKHVTLLISSLI